MRKIALALFIIGTNIVFTACTDDSLAEAQKEHNTKIYADDGGTGDGHIDPPEEPPSGGGQ